CQQLPEDDGPAAPLHVDPVLRPGAHEGFRPAPAVFPQQDLAAQAECLDAGSDVHFAADHGVVAVAAAADGARHDFAAIDADAYIEGRQAQRLALPVEGVHALL